MKKSLCFALVATLGMSSLAFAQRTTTSIASPASAVELNLGLEHMSLTAAQIRKRDRLLKPIYSNYQNVNLSSVSNALERAYGMNIFHYMEGGKLNLGNKKGVMESAVRYYMGIESLFDQADESVIPFKNSIKVGSKDYYGRYTGKNVAVKLIEGNKKHWEEKTSFSSPSVLATYVKERTDRVGIFNIEKDRKALYTSTQNPLFSAPIMSDFLEAMKNLNLKGLDATVNFVNGDISGTKYQVIYPHYSRIAPIPQPVIFLSESATYYDIVEMLQQHAPRIHAYNKLFNASVLPSIKDINELLSKYPNILTEVQKAKGYVSRQNLISAIQQAFLNVTYGVGAGVVGAAALLTAPVTIFAIASSPILSPVFITNVIIFL